MINQHDVAKEAGVSSASVSRYINNPSSIGLKTANRIKAAIDKLGYRPNFTAKSLKTGRFHRVGIISAAKGPFYWDVLDYIEETLSEWGYFINIAITRESEQSRLKIIQLVKNKQVDGVIIFPLLSGEDDNIIDYLKKMGDKFVVLDRLYDDDSMHQIATDNYEAGRTAARVLLKRGHKDFLFIWGVKDVFSAHERFKGFYEELKNAGITLEDNRQIMGEFTAEHTYNTVIDSFSELPRFTAVFASNDPSAIGFIRAAEKNGLKTPVDFSIIGFDNADFSAYTNPRLATFRQPVQTLGTLAARMLISRIEGKKIEERRVVLKAEFILRESVSAIF
ncbi:MAG: LacI family transcriptional regulator [Spirochaetes bacterium]|nr:LacI family transcriptional regulator [Spirochaetota bacterium]